MTPRTGTRNPKRINLACLDNLNRYLTGGLSFREWERRQEELESRLTPAPELPFAAAIPGIGFPPAGGPSAIFPRPKALPSLSRKLEIRASSGGDEKDNL